MKEDWTDQLRQRLEGHKAEPPAGLWEDISKQMGFQTEPVPKATIVKRWHLAAAATILALVGFFVYQNLDDSHLEQPQQAEAIKQSVTPQKPEANPYEEIIQPEPDLLVQVQHDTTRKPMDLPSDSPTEIISVPTSVTEESTEPEEAVNNTDKLQDEKEQKAAPQVLPTNKDVDWDKELPPVSTSHKWTIGINASGGLLTAQNSELTGRVYHDMVYFDSSGQNNIEPGYISDGSPINPYLSHYTLYTKTNVVAKHRLPVRIGLSLQYQLNEKLALLSGINYTFLYSEFSEPLYNSISYNQKLHYLGVPLGISWNLWSTSRFSFYVSGQVMLEKCLNDKPWQWSLGAALGAEYGITRQLGLYLEPSLGYFFNDGTQLEHYYKEHPFAPSIEFGLRVYLNK